ncbi:MAG: class II fructose-bisphosphate aldolase, partial [Eubacterium pyruvativorans]
MALVTSTEMFRKAYHGGYAVGAFNVNNMEIVQGIVEAADELRSPLILQASAGARKYATSEYLMHLVQAAVESTDIPIVMHLDHGADFDICKACVDSGFTSVMIDASGLPFEENIATSKRVAEYAHDHGCVVEAELGTLAGIEDDVNVAHDKAM